jgi:tetratricopeptide (TPR) repeat protein
MFTFLERFAWFRPDPTSRGRALAALARGDYLGAERELGEALTVADTPADRAFLLNKRGVARVALGRKDDALDDFRAALLGDPSFAPALTNIGNLLFEAGDVDAAIAQYEAAVRADDYYAIAHLNLGIAYKHAGRVAEGVRELRRANRLEVPFRWGLRKRS